MGEVVGDLPLAHVFQVKLQAAREDGCGQFLRVGGSKDEFDVFRRLFECLQQGIEAAGRKHVYFVNEIDFVVTFDRGIGDVVQELAGFFYT
ncbi:hypothetical protein HMPREF9080_02554 [Cardiobacterium valvarum F0432]|uniref:Uncharacterized protein n=1 Tax=Cardiobacterium valvarum F0432 TaxID=797473 RepID=G9ZIE5_9GAMM|nr:hypothetical protein HMPREF9080_02554 [Cardiobacterium valvarum F0432]